MNSDLAIRGTCDSALIALIWIFESEVIGLGRSPLAASHTHTEVLCRLRMQSASFVALALHVWVLLWSTLLNMIGSAKHAIPFGGMPNWIRLRHHPGSCMTFALQLPWPLGSSSRHQEALDLPREKQP